MLDLSPSWFMDAILSSYFKIKMELACYLWQPKSQLLKNFTWYLGTKLTEVMENKTGKWTVLASRVLGTAEEKLRVGWGVDS